VTRQRKFLNKWIGWKYSTKTKNDTDFVFMLKRSDGVISLYYKLRTEFAKLLEITGCGGKTTRPSEPGLQ
jgi:hypothetical protein